MQQFAFEKLTAWKLSRRFVSRIYKVTSMFPEDEKYGLVSQLRRASISISSNLAEGSSRLSPVDQVRFYQYAYSSLMEVINQLILSADMSFISIEILNELRKDGSEISNVINGLVKSNRSKK
ncbi:four helix bundle protein [Carboxylicivirga mesophila]|uniref:Four helix bundle protein n=1 Tax=Carboxylicivirga mesophila TaxID=1166478 RepID=A0ABS5KCU3_9BACT|nr:four helix bundle protein [Carboxylicivirga mesophila]MBS2212318.1 four helix bundle protein [Carboxylicivirga mesophila]